MTLVDLRHARAFLEQEICLAHVIREHAVRDEPEAVADDDADFAELLGQLQRRGEHFLLVSRPRTISSSFMTFAGLK